MNIMLNVQAKVLKETEKAYQIQISFWTNADKPVQKDNLWCPKSCCVSDGKIVTEVADFILDQWYTKWIKRFNVQTRLSTSVKFDFELKEKILEVMKNRNLTERSASLFVAMTQKGRYWYLKK